MISADVKAVSAEGCPNILSRLSADFTERITLNMEKDFIKTSQNFWKNVKVSIEGILLLQPLPMSVCEQLVQSCSDDGEHLMYD